MKTKTTNENGGGEVHNEKQFKKRGRMEGSAWYIKLF